MLSNNFNKKNIDPDLKKKQAVIIKTSEDKLDNKVERIDKPRENSASITSGSSICKICSGIISKGQCLCTTAEK